MIIVRALGPVEVSVNGGKAPAALLWSKHLALLVYLARSPKRARTREHLVGLLWTDKPEHDARHSLNEAVRQWRKAIGIGGLESDAAQVRLLPGAVELDTDTLETLVAARDYARAASLVQGEFLEGFSVPGASEFDTWLAAERDHWRRRSVEVLERRADQLLAMGDVGAANETIRRARVLDWRPEVAVRTAMRGLALAGDRAGALALFGAFARRLKEELGAEPDAETHALAERVRRERTWRLPAAPAAAASHGLGGAGGPLVGRAAELEALVDSWAACRAESRATVIVIEGDPGAGKTRLAEEFAARARLDGAVVAAVRAVEADRGEPWSGVLGMARGGLLEAPGAAGAPPPMLGQLRGSQPLEAPSRALSELLSAIADQQPVMVLVDDVHWLDRESLLALGAAARDLTRSPVFCVLTVMRQASCPELDELRARLGRQLAGTSVSLQAFGDDAVRELARRALPSYGSEQLDRLTRRVLADSAGIPLLVTALLDAVSAGLDLRDGGKAWPETDRTLNDTLPGELPDNVVGAIRVNYRRLSANAQLALRVVAVLGGRVSAATLHRASGVGGDALAQALDELEWQHWLTAESRGYAFVAPIVGAVIDRDMAMEGERQRIRDAAGVDVVRQQGDP